jgi:hypothetical protein
MKERIDFVGHEHIEVSDIKENRSFDNVIISASNQNQKWIEETTEQIGDWRAKFRSAYIKWALCINSIEKAIDRYSEKEYEFFIQSYRNDEHGKICLSKIALWKGNEVSDNYRIIMPLMAENGIVELYSIIEEYIFISYKIFLNHNPSVILSGQEFKELKKLYKARNNSTELAEEWNVRWKERINNWHRKKAYDGIKKIFNSYSQVSKLSMGGLGEALTEIAEGLNVVALLRNLLVHNEPLVTEEFARLTSQNICPFPNIFEKGKKLAPELSTLMGIEHMCDRMLSVINFSCFGLIKKRIY